MTKGAVTEGAKGDGSGPTLRKFAVMLTALRRDVDTLKKAVVRGGATTLDALRDVEVLYDHWTDLPRHGQALRWDKTRESRFHGLATFSDPEVVADYFTVSITDTTSPQGIEAFMVDSDWDVTRPCLVHATAVLDASYAPQEVDPPTTPATYIEGPAMVLQVVDGDSGRVSALGSEYEVAYSERPLSSRYVAFHSVSWTMLRGRPKVAARLDLTTAQAAGLSLPTTLRVITRVTRL